jgi:hypothetical protein
MQCMQCGTAAEGRFCPSCGASLKALPCPGCGEEIPAGTRFCTACGSRMSARTAPRREQPGVSHPAAAAGGQVGWWISGALLVVLLGIGAFLVLGDSENGAGPAPALGPASNVDLSSMTPREAADNLFFRVMGAVERGDYAEADAFLPMAVNAHEMAGPLDADGLFHLALLQRAAGRHEEALASALEGLEGNPDHLLNLYAAAEAAREIGELAQAREHYVRMLEAWDRELAALRPEYDEHHPLLPLIREDGEAFLAEAGP